MLLRKKTKTKTKHTNRFNRMLFDYTKQDKMQILEGVLFFKATNTTKTNKQLLPVWSLQKDVT